MGQWRLLGESSAHLLDSELCLQLAEYPSCTALLLRERERERERDVCEVVWERGSHTVESLSLLLSLAGVEEEEEERVWVAEVLCDSMTHN